MSKLVSLFSLIVLVCASPVSSFACSANGGTESNSKQEASLSEIKGDLMDFKFENYSVSDTQKVRETFVQAFPKGSAFDSFTATMEALGAENRGGDDGVRPQNQIYYYYEAGKGLVKTVWIVGAKHNENREIQEITVKSGGVGP